MSDPSTLDGTPVTTDPVRNTELLELWDSMASTHRFTEHLKANGFAPPDGRPGWAVVREYGPDGEDLGLVWAEPWEE